MTKHEGRLYCDHCGEEITDDNYKRIHQMVKYVEVRTSRILHKIKRTSEKFFETCDYHEPCYERIYDKKNDEVYI